MYRASDRVAHAEWIDRLEAVAEELELDAEARSIAVDVFLSTMPVEERSKPAVLAASCYAGSLIAGDARSQGEIADAAGVSRLAIQSRWKAMLEDAGFEPPSW